MVAATARFLAGKDFPVLGKPYGRLLRPLLVALNHLPRSARNWVYRAGSGREGLPAEVIAALEAEELSRQVVLRYPSPPAGGFQAVMVGSLTGSAVHLAAALGAPVLPQTLLLPLARPEVDVDDPAGDIERTAETVAALAASNPDLVIRQMFDPCQDRLTLARFSYLRVKRLRLGACFEDFLERTLAPGGTIYVLDCRHRWPVATVGERHTFQFGGIGDIAPDEYRTGSERIAEFLRCQGSTARSWRPPQPDSEKPEAEWGFEPALLGDIERFASTRGFVVRHIVFDEADSLSGATADLYRQWYTKLGYPADRLFVESFVLLDPYWVLRAGAVPYWMTFNSDKGASHLESYLDHSEAFSTIHISVIANGMESPGLAGFDRWRAIQGRATVSGDFAGLDADRYPSDLATFARYRDPLLASRPRRPLPPPLSTGEVDAALGAYARLGAEDTERR